MKKAIFYTNPFRSNAQIRCRRLRNYKVAQKSLLLALAMAVIVAPFVQMVPASADRLADLANEIAVMNEKIKGLEGEANRLANQSRTLANEIARLDAEAAAVQAKIDLSKTEEQRLNDEIAMNEIKIEQNRKALGKIIADSYLESKVSLLEKMASSQTLSSFIDQETAAAAASDALGAKVKEIKALKIKLEDDRQEVQRLIREQQEYKTVLAAKKEEQAQILARTKGEEAIFQNMVNEADGQRQALIAEQKRIMDELLAGQNNSNRPPGAQAIRNFSGNLGCSGGYTYCAGPLDYMVDEWQLYARECVSYAAWAMKYRFGKYVVGFQGAGNAREWPTTATRLMGARADNYPAVGSVAVWDDGIFGHVMVVEQILSDGWLLVSQYNYAWSGQYSTMEIPSDSAVYVHFRNG